MQQYALKRIALFFPTILLVTVIVFVVMRLIPGDACIAILSDGEATYTQAELEDCRVELNLNSPLVIQYFDWVGGADDFPNPGSKKRLSIRSQSTLKMKILHSSKTPRPTMIRSPRLLPTGSTMTVTTSRNIRPNQTTANQPLPVLLLAKIPN